MVLAYKMSVCQDVNSHFQNAFVVDGQEDLRFPIRCLRQVSDGDLINDLQRIYAFVLVCAVGVAFVDLL